MFTGLGGNASDVKFEVKADGSITAASTISSSDGTNKANLNNGSITVQNPSIPDDETYFRARKSSTDTQFMIWGDGTTLIGGSQDPRVYPANTGEKIRLNGSDGSIKAASADFSGGSSGQDDAPGVKIYKNNSNALYAPIYLEQGNTIGNFITGKNGFTGETTFAVGVDGDVIANNVQMASANTGPLAGFRNQLINGNFQVWQRGEAVVTADNVPEYTADRWNVRCANSTQASIKVFSDNGSYPSTTTELPNGFSSGWETNYNGDGGTFKLCQGIELGETGKAGIFYQGTEWTLSVWANFDLTAELAYQAQFKDAVGYATSADVVTVIEQNWVSTGETSNGFTRYKATGTISGTPAASATSLTICIRFTSGKPAGADSGRRALTGAQFEAGPMATPYEVIPIQTQLANCERYYQLLPRLSMAPVTTNATNARACSLSFRTAMRTTPTLTADQDVRLNSVTITNDNNYGLTVEGQATDPDASSYIRNLQFSAEL